MSSAANHRAEGPLLMVAIPCLNEAPTIAGVVANVPRQIEGIGRIEIVVFDDGSTDETADRARDAGAEVVSSRNNKGLGATFRDAVGVGFVPAHEALPHVVVPHVAVLIVRRVDVRNIGLDPRGGFDRFELQRLART